MASNPKIIEGERFDRPLVFSGAIDEEPERYVAEKPYDLTKYEFSILRRESVLSFWFNLTSGATAGIAISLFGKAIAALVQKETPTIELWEVLAILAGIGASIVLRNTKSKDDEEREALSLVVESHFNANRPRRLHLTAGQDSK
jgi:hypothetical protein